MTSTVRMFRCSAALALTTLAVVMFDPRSPIAAQQRPAERQLWDGVYTADQAERGKSAYETSCGRCHNNSLIGSERAPALTGEEFWGHWEDSPLNSLFTKIRDTMPPGGIETVADDAKLEILAYILHMNEIPAGTTALTLEPEALDTIYVVKKGSPRATTAANFSLVQVVGCLGRTPDRGWVLTHATEPTVTRDEQGDEASRQRTLAEPLGGLQFSLLSVHPSLAPDSLLGQRVEARGLVFRRPGDNRLNLISMQGVDTRCPTP